MRNQPWPAAGDCVPPDPRCKQSAGIYKNQDLHSFSFEQLTKAVGGLLDRAIAAGEIRNDISPEDLLRALVGMCYMHDQAGWQASVLRLVDVFVDGLRIHPGARRSEAER